MQETKKIYANWFRKGSMALTALVAAIVCVYLYYAITSNDMRGIIEGIPDVVIFILIDLVFLGGVLVAVYQLFSIVVNRMVLSPEGIEIRKFLRSIVTIPTEDVIRVDGVRETVIGNSRQNRTVYKIITNTKTYEVNSHEFFGLRKAMHQWMQENMKEERGEENDD